MITTPATDGDSTYPNNDIIYRIDTGAKDKFGMDAGTGRITVTNGADLDRDVYGTRYTLTVREKLSKVYRDILALLRLIIIFVHLRPIYTYRLLARVSHHHHQCLSLCQW